VKAISNINVTVSLPLGVDF